ncbi:hypothetical protein DMC01_03915 [Campylobacter troglodytis]|nr:hypothetical protein DMC01_03915 [Campylobacter troglodytis]
MSAELAVDENYFLLRCTCLCSRSGSQSMQNAWAWGLQARSVFLLRATHSFICKKEQGHKILQNIVMSLQRHEIISTKL